MIEAVVFDMDGLLVDSEPLWQRARSEALGADRLHWTDADQERIMGSSTQSWAEFLAERLDHEFSPATIIDRVVNQMVEYYHEQVPLLPGAREVITGLAGRFPLGLASGSSYRLIEAVMASTGWDQVFGEVLSADDVARGKPAPDIYLEITRRMRVPAHHIAVFEDSGNGILAAHAAGHVVIAVPGAYHRPAHDTLQKADLVLDSLLAFDPAMLQQL